MSIRHRRHNRRDSAQPGRHTDRGGTQIPEDVVFQLRTQAKRFAVGLSMVTLASYLEIMPVLSRFYGIVVSMYFMDNKQHHLPHIHARHQNDEAVFAIPDGEILDGTLPSGKMKLVQAWIEIHRQELLDDWQLAVNGELPKKIPPLK